LSTMQHSGIYRAHEKMETHTETRRIDKTGKSAPEKTCNWTFAAKTTIVVAAREEVRRGYTQKLLSPLSLRVGGIKDQRAPQSTDYHL